MRLVAPKPFKSKNLGKNLGEKKARATLTCHQSCVTNHLAPVIRRVSPVTCHLSRQQQPQPQANSPTMHSRMILEDLQLKKFFARQFNTIYDPQFKILRPKN